MAWVYRPVSASATLQGSVQDELTIESDTDWDCDIDVDTNDVRLRITGKFSTTIDWEGKMEVVDV
jgi:hypothetical protein